LKSNKPLGLSKSATNKIAKFFGRKNPNQANHWAKYLELTYKIAKFLG
jgi:hypothetical protein